MIKVIDNYLPEKDWVLLEDAVMNPTNAFPWHFSPETLQEPLLKVDLLDGYQFTHNLYNIMQVPRDSKQTYSRQKYTKSVSNIPVFNKQIFQHFLPFVNNPKLNCKVLIKMKMNLNPRRSTIFEHGFHVDNDLPNAKTAVFYFNDNNGYTIFEKTGEKVYSKANRIVIFDNNNYHSGSTCTDKQRRVVMNINFFEEYSTEDARAFDKTFRDALSGKDPFQSDYNTRTGRPYNV